MQQISKRLRVVSVAVLALTLLPVQSASAGTTGANPARCGDGETWKYVDFNVAGAIMRQEIRHSWGCGGVAWGRLSRVGGSWPSLDIQQSAWNPGGPSQDGVPNTNYTYTINGNADQYMCAGFQAWTVNSFGARKHVGWFMTCWPR